MPQQPSKMTHKHLTPCWAPRLQLGSRQGCTCSLACWHKSADNNDSETEHMHMLATPPHTATIALLPLSLQSSHTA